MAVVILSIVILLLGVVAFIGIFNSIHWKREYEGCRERRREDSKERDNALAEVRKIYNRRIEEADSKARATIEALNDQYDALYKKVSVERELRDEMIQLFFTLHPDLAQNFGHSQYGDFYVIDWSKVKNYIDQQEASDRFSEYVKAKRDAMGHESKGS